MSEQFQSRHEKHTSESQSKREMAVKATNTSVACIASVSARVRRESWDESKKKKAPALTFAL